MEALDELGALHVGQPWPSLARSLAKGVASAAGLYALGQWNGPANFSCTRVELEKLANGRILQTLEILPIVSAPVPDWSFGGARRWSVLRLSRGFAGTASSAQRMKW